VLDSWWILQRLLIPIRVHCDQQRHQSKRSFTNTSSRTKHPTKTVSPVRNVNPPPSIPGITPISTSLYVLHAYTTSLIRIPSWQKLRLNKITYWLMKSVGMKRGCRVG
jgi:hypothetical protein